MCRAKHQGGRRCPSCGSYKSYAAGRRRRKANRATRKAVSNHLAAAGLPKTAAAVLAAPPSSLTGFLSGAGLKPDFVAGLTLPSTKSGPPPADHLLDLLTAERVEHAGGPAVPENIIEAALPPKKPTAGNTDSPNDSPEQDEAPEPEPKPAKPVSPEQAAMDAANARWEAADAAYKATNPGTPERKEATAALQAARDERAIARFELALSKAKRASTKDAKYAELTDAKAEAIMRGIQARAATTTDAAFDSLTPPSLSETDRDTTVYGPGTFTINTGSGTQEVEGRVLDGGTAIWRRDYGDFVVLQQKTDGVYYPVAAATSKADAKTKADRIPNITVPPAPEDADQLTRQAHVLMEDAAHQVASDAAEGKVGSTAAARKTALDGRIVEARGKLSAGAAGPFEAERYEAAGRHRRRVMEKAADEAGKKAHAAALAAGASAAEAKAAAKKARMQAMGTPTRGGGVIPHFDHKIPPPSVGKAQHSAAWRSGIRVFGSETAADYAIVKARTGNTAAWGFSGGGNGSMPSTSNITSLKNKAIPLLKTLKPAEKDAIVTYTGGSYQSINAAITGREKSPSGHIQSTVTNLESAFDRLSDAKKDDTEVATVVRGTKVPSAWKGSRDDYLDHAFPVGAKMQIGKVTSCTTSTGTANCFSGGSSTGYLMAIRTRDGIPVKSISLHAGEDEVILPPGANLRCVHVDKSGTMPVVYLVAEDLVAEADQAA